MQTNVIIVDDFLVNPHEVRDHALSLNFAEYGNYPGSRTEPDYNESVMTTIANILRPHAGEVTEFNGTQYQLTTAHMKSWVHADVNNTWAGVLFLTPDAPLESGTGLYRHKDTGVSTYPHNNPSLANVLENDGSDYTKWELADVISNKFNRLVLYRGDLFHSSQQYFGHGLHDGRLFQTFFISTEF